MFKQLLGRQDTTSPKYSRNEGFNLFLTNHRLTYHPGTSKLVVSFDNAGSHTEGPFQSRSIWGEKFYCSEGYSLLGVVAREPDWFRCSDVISALKQLAAAGFFKSFQHVLFTGSSMGGFAACAFAPLSPGCTVLALNPQATRDPKRVPWEPRFIAGKDRNWSLPYSDAAKGIRSASRAHIVFDPLNRLDQRHVRMLVDKKSDALLPIPAGGHGVPPMLVQMGTLKDLTRDVIEHRLDRSVFLKQIRRRKNTLRYYNILATESLCRRRNAFALRAANAGLAKFPNSDLWELKALALVALGKPVLALQALEEHRKRKKNA
ncbi:hypothetical protein ACIPCF_00145 [Paracoccus marcusii]|uniref:hypothetical protein n=1 Tax=Paracoccus marcusii TaxID=59779 RepID=UPI0038BB4E7F